MIGWGSSRGTNKSGHERYRVNRTPGGVLGHVWSCYGGSVRGGADVSYAALICTCSKRSNCVHGGVPLAVSWLDVVVMVTLGLALAVISTTLELLEAVSPRGVEIAGGVV